MALQITIEEVLVAFLNKSIRELENNETKMADYCQFEKKQRLNDPNVTLMIYKAGDYTFELVVDHDNVDKVITQRTYSSQAAQLYELIKKTSKGDRGFGFVQKYYPEMEANVNFSYNQAVSFVQADYVE